MKSWKLAVVIVAVYLLGVFSGRLFGLPGTSRMPTQHLEFHPLRESPEDPMKQVQAIVSGAARNNYVVGVSTLMLPTSQRIGNTPLVAYESVLVLTVEPK